MNLFGPKLRQFKLIQEEIASLGIRSNNKVKLVALEKPLSLPFFNQDAAFLNLIEFDNIAGRVRILALVLIGYEDSFNWIDQQVPHVAIHAQPVDFLYCSFDSLHGKEAPVGHLSDSVLHHFADDVFQLLGVVQFHQHQKFEIEFLILEVGYRCIRVCYLVLLCLAIILTPVEGGCLNTILSLIEHIRATH